MSVVVEFGIPTERFVLGRYVARTDGLEAELERVVPAGEGAVPYLRVTGPRTALDELAGALERSVLSWNATSEQFYETPPAGYFTTGAPPNDFGTMLERSFDRQGIAYNVYLRYQGAGGDVRIQRYVHQGQPSDHAVRATWALSLAENDEIRDENGDPSGTTVSDESTYFAPRQSSASVYNVINVEVVVWRI
jgi:hypothetical protein